MPEFKEVTIPGCSAHAGVHTIKLKLLWTCPQCGGPRGAVRKIRSYDGSLSLVVDGWDNPCGHVDKYHELRRVPVVKECVGGVHG